MRLHLSVFPLIAATSLVIISCNPEPVPEYVKIVFEIPISISPFRDTIAIGDTLWLTANFSDSIREVNTQKRYRVTPKYFDFKTRIGLFKFANPSLTIAQQPGFTTAFTVINKTGSLTGLGETFGGLKFFYSNEHYQARIGFVARQKGVACLNLMDGASRLHTQDPEPDVSFLKLPPSLTQQAQRAVYATTLYPINQGNTNFHLYKQYCQALSASNSSDGNAYYEQKQSYTFIVK